MGECSTHTFKADILHIVKSFKYYSMNVVEWMQSIGHPLDKKVWLLYVTLDQKSSLKSLGYICSNSQKYIVWVKMINFTFMPKIIKKLSKDYVRWRYLVNFLP